MRSLFRLLCVFALGVHSLVGCGDGTPRCEASEDCAEGECKDGVCRLVFACTEQGVREAIAKGGGPHFFDCDGPQTVVTAQEIIIENNVNLDGERNLTLDGNGDHRVLRVHGDVTLSGMTITGGHIRDGNGGGIAVRDRLTLNRSTVLGNTAKSYRSRQFRGNGGGIHNTGTLTLNDSTVSDNSGVGYVETSNCLLLCPEIWGGYGGGIHNEGGQVKLTNSTVSGSPINGQTRGPRDSRAVSSAMGLGAWLSWIVSVTTGAN